MKGLLAKRSPRRAIGLLVGDREVTLSVLAATPLGKVELARGSEPRDNRPLAEVIGPMLDPWLGRRPRPKVVLGVPGVRVFHSARSMAASGRKEPEIWLQEALRTPGTRVEEMLIDVVEASVGKRTLAGLVSCRRRVLAESLATLAGRQARVALAEPAPSALLRAARARQKAPRGSKLAARFLLGESRALGMLAAGGIPLHWREFDLTPGDEPKALLGAFYAMRMHARGWQADVGLDAVLIHGRPDLAPRMAEANLAEKLGVKVIRADGPGFDAASTALGLALGGLAEEGGFDLARTLKPRESIREIFPWGDLAVQAAMLSGAMLLVADRSQSLEKAHANTRASLAKFKWLGDRPEADLLEEKKVLEQKDKMAEGFLASRVHWSGHVAGIASRIPENTRVTALSGSGELELQTGKGPPGSVKKTLVLRLETPIPPTGETPRELDDLLASLRDFAPLKRDFPVIELKDIKASRATAKGTEAAASYSIICLPPAPKAAAPKKEKEKEKE